VIITERESYYLDKAILLAEKAFEMEEVPVGAVVVENDNIIADGFNEKESFCDPLRHAEIVAMQRAARYKNDWRLNNCSLYTTLEPCIMCCGAILHFRIKRVVFCLKEIKFGGVVSKAKILDINGLNHRVDYAYGYKEDYVKQLISTFFKGIRKY
jgi:tRNA(adenine34) deaminase